MPCAATWTYCKKAASMGSCFVTKATGRTRCIPTERLSRPWRQLLANCARISGCPMAAIAVAKAVRASFVREVFTGVYDSDMGLWQPDAAAALDYRQQLCAADIRLFFNIEPEFARPLARRPIGALARSVVVSSLADAILISGAMAGAEVDLDHIREAKSAVPNTPVLANTGVKIETVRATLAVADGVIVGTGLKRDGYTWNPVDPERVRRFMDEVYLAREQSED